MLQETKVVQKKNNRKPIVMLAVHYTQQCEFLKICSLIFLLSPSSCLILLFMMMPAIVISAVEYDKINSITIL
jgi:hypothetical protein